MSESSRKSHLLRRYGITPEQYEQMLESQGRRCAICDRHENEFNIRLAVDHDHKTGEIRGALCAYCNHRVVGRHRDPVLLRKVADYISQGTGWFVPSGQRATRRKKRVKK